MYKQLAILICIWSILCYLQVSIAVLLMTIWLFSSALHSYTVPSRLWYIGLACFIFYVDSSGYWLPFLLHYVIVELIQIVIGSIIGHRDSTLETFSNTILMSTYGLVRCLCVLLTIYYYSLTNDASIFIALLLFLEPVGFFHLLQGVLIRCVANIIRHPTYSIFNPIHVMFLGHSSWRNACLRHWFYSMETIENNLFVGNDVKQWYRAALRPTEPQPIVQHSFVYSPIVPTTYRMYDPTLDYLDGLSDLFHWMETVTFCKHQNTLSSSVTCVCCLEECTAGQSVAQISCSHIFHRKCIYAWFKEENLHGQSSTCPLCKRVVDFKYPFKHKDNQPNGRIYMTTNGGSGDVVY